MTGQHDLAFASISINGSLYLRHTLCRVPRWSGFDSSKLDSDIPKILS